MKKQWDAECNKFVVAIKKFKKFFCTYTQSSKLWKKQEVMLRMNIIKCDTNSMLKSQKDVMIKRVDTYIWNRSIVRIRSRERTNTSRNAADIPLNGIINKLF